MPTTTNFGWTTPADTDLVKDGAAAIRTALGGVDTSFVDLKGGTTGQVLTKASNTDLDFNFTSPLANPLTTTGDIIYSSSGSTLARLGIGTTGQVLNVAAGVPAWTTPAAGGGMTLISTTAMTGSSITLSSITGTYKDLIVLINNVTMNTGDAELTLDFNGAGNVAAGTGRFKTSLGDFQDDVLKFTLGNNTTRTVAQNHYCIIKNYASTTAFKPFEFSGSAQISGGGVGGSVGGGSARTTSAITSLVIANNQGRTFSAGEILLYGAN
jgi:hypothetical protein